MTEHDPAGLIVGQAALLRADPELSGFLSTQERAWLTRLRLPVVGVDPGQLELETLLRAADSFGVLVLDGMVLRELRVGEQSALWLLGPGDYLVDRGNAPSDLLGGGSTRAVAPTRLLLLGRPVLAAARRAPNLISALQVRAAEHNERLAAQMVICQMPRVEERVLAMLWLLAEVWGRVTSAGTALPVGLTHEIIGALVGARRSTVTLAIRELVERGAILRRDDGWLLLEAITGLEPSNPIDGEPALIANPPASQWQPSAPPANTGFARSSPETLLSSLRALREDHALNRRRVAANLEITMDARDRNRQLLAELREQRLGHGLDHHDRT